VNLDDIIKNRRSIRDFSPQPVSDEQLQELLEAARWAPSGTNRQPWRFVILKGDSEIQLLSGAVTQSFVLRAPVVLVCCLDRRSFTKDKIAQRIEELVEAGVISREVADLLYVRKMPKKVDEVTMPVSAYLDMGIVLEHLSLKAFSMGLGTCCVRMFDAEKITFNLQLPEGIEIVSLLPVGVPAENPQPRPRLPVDELVIEPQVYENSLLK